MPNILDYIDWRGDLTINNSAFNKVDNLIFAQLAHIDFSNIVSAEFDKKISVSDAWELYNKSADRVLGAILPDEIVKMFRKMSESNRYKDFSLSGYVNHIDEEKEMQFSAVCISSKSFIYISYRGTDDTLVGWKEDFNLGIMEEVPSHSNAVNYLNSAMKAIKSLPVYVGGHSKGGNLAIYASVNAKKQFKKRIKKVFSNDGPGFSGKVIESDNYKEMQDKIISIVPEGSLVGQLLNHGENNLIIKSENSFLMQHHAFSWEVLGNKFVTVDKLSDKSILADNIITSWLSEMSTEEKERFVQNIYDIFTASSAKTLTDITRDKIGFIKALGTLDKETIRGILKSMGKMAEQAAKAIIKK